MASFWVVLFSLGLVAALGAFLYHFVVVTWFQEVRDQRNRSWQQFAEQAGWSFEPGTRFPRRVHGSFLGYQCHVETVPRDHSVHTVFRTLADPVWPVGFVLYRKGSFENLSRALGFYSIKTGDAAFDQHFIVRCDREEMALHLLTAQVRSALLAHDLMAGGLSSDDQKFTLDDRGALWECKGFVANIDRLQTILESQTHVVHLLCQAQLQRLQHIETDAQQHIHASPKNG